MTQQASVISKNQIDTFLNSDPKLKAELNNMKSNLKELIIKASIHESNGNFKAAMIYSTVALYIASSVSPTLATQQMTLIQNMAQAFRFNQNLLNQLTSDFIINQKFMMDFIL